MGTPIAAEPTQRQPPASSVDWAFLLYRLRRAR